MSKRFLLFYDYPPDIVQRREPHRDAHLAHARAWKKSGLLVAAGATGDPPAGALLVFDVEDPGQVEEFVREDPYVLADLVTDWRLEPWLVVV